MKSACLSLLALSVLSAAAGERRLSLDDYRDHMQGAWIGQMVGVSWGTPTEFRFNEVVIPADKVPVWQSDFPLRMAYGNDDLYVEMTFLKTLEDYGLDVSPRQAGIDFASSEYQLWCANLAGRTNLRCGIAPPDCSHPKFNGRSNDIDYQIEADYSGIISPGCPQEAVRLGNVFGRLMNFGDGVWAGQFVGAMYAEAFFTGDVDKLLDAGLRAIPAESDYATMVREVRAWHREEPTDWEKTWRKIRAKYSKAANPAMRDSNGGIDVRLNGAMIVLGLLYGEGDLDRSMVVAMRGGWDSDCNPSNVGGILMCARGAKELPAKYTEKLDPERKFSYTAYNQRLLYAVCEKLARAVVVRYGGRVEKDDCGKEWFVIPDQVPVPDAFVPSWQAGPAAGSVYTEAEMRGMRHGLRLPSPHALKDPDPTVCVQKTLDALYPGWKTSANAPDMEPGVRLDFETTLGRRAAGLVTHPPKRGAAVTLSRTVKVPAGSPNLHFEVANAPRGDFRLVVRIDGAAVLSTVLKSPAKGNDAWNLQCFDMSLEPWTGKTVALELVNEPTDWFNEAAFWTNLKLAANSGGF